MVLWIKFFKGCDHSNDKAAEWYFPVVLFIMLCKVVLAFESVDEILNCDHSNERYWAFPVVPFITLFKVVLAFESVNEILTCDHLNESYWAVLSCGTVYYAPQAEVVLTFECKDTKTQMLVFNKKGYWISILFSPVLYPSVSYIIPSQRGQ